ncbi:MAG: TIGR02466 family protein [Pseudomonadota bacterium]
MPDYADLKIKAQKNAMFETPVVLAKFENSEALLDDLKQVILARMAQDPQGIQRSNVSGWHSDTDMLNWGGDAARVLSEKAIAMAKRLSAFSDASHDDFDWWCQMWANVSGPGASNHLHIHPGNLWSGVLYIDMGGGGVAGDDITESEGRFYFEDPRFPISVMHNTRFRFAGPDGKGEPVHPELRTQRGDFVMFPAWLRHGVRPYKGQRQRISIALNVDATPL